MMGPHVPDGSPEPSMSGGGLLAELRGSSAESIPGAEASAPPASRVRRVSTQTLVMALVLAASAASLYTMRKQGMGAGMTMAMPVKLEYEPEKLKPEDARRRDRIMAELARSVTGVEFHDEPLRKNPFRLAVAPATASAGGLPQDAGVSERARREEEIRTALARLTLNGVMQGPVPLARVNGRTVRVTDTIDNLFLVTEINERSVEVMVDDVIYTLQMSEAAHAPGRRPGGPLAPPLPPGRR